jgi:DNA-binding NarL/FixJ family response regulator
LAKILLAERHLKLRLLVKALIETREGWKVCGEVADGLEAVQKTLELKPDLVILDFAMSGLNGLEAAARILAAHPKMPVILHTFYGFEVMVAEAKKVGVSEVVGKGESGERLLAAIEKHLGNAGPVFDAAPAVSGPDTAVDPRDPPAVE